MRMCRLYKVLREVASLRMSEMRPLRKASVPAVCKCLVDLVRKYESLVETRLRYDVAKRPHHNNRAARHGNPTAKAPNHISGPQKRQEYAKANCTGRKFRPRDHWPAFGRVPYREPTCSIGLIPSTTLYILFQPNLHPLLPALNIHYPACSTCHCFIRGKTERHKRQEKQPSAEAWLILVTERWRR
jgi:hypothetical protein